MFCCFSLVEFIFNIDLKLILHKAIYSRCFGAGNDISRNRHSCYTAGMDHGQDGFTPRHTNESPPRD